MSEISRKWSPYNYVEGNPIRKIDVDGMWSDDGNGGSITTDPGEIETFVQQARAQQQTQDGGKDKNNKQKPQNSKSNLSTPKKKSQFWPSWYYSIPIIGTAGTAGDEFNDGHYGKAVLTEATAMGEMFLFAENEVISGYKSIAGLFTKSAATDLTATLSKMEFKELQNLVRASQPEMDLFFNSEGSTVPSKAALQTYKELITRISTGTGGAYQKVTTVMADVYSQRLNWINNALKYEK